MLQRRAKPFRLQNDPDENLKHSGRLLGPNREVPEVLLIRGIRLRKFFYHPVVVEKGTAPYPAAKGSNFSGLRETASAPPAPLTLPAQSPTAPCGARRTEPLPGRFAYERRTGYAAPLPSPVPQCVRWERWSYPRWYKRSGGFESLVRIPGSS